VLKGINERYDALRANKERAAERYKADFKKWREFNKWLFAEDDEHRKRRTEAGILKEERKRRDLASVMRKRQKMIEIGPYLARFEGELEGVAGLTFISSTLVMLNVMSLTLGSFVNSSTHRPHGTMGRGQGK